MNFAPFSFLSSQVTPSVITTGLKLYYDVADTASYPGTGTTIFDLTVNNYDGTLTNGVGFSSNNGGSLTFDGTDDFVLIGTLTGAYSTGCTVEGWVLNTQTGSTGGNFDMICEGNSTNDFVLGTRRPNLGGNDRFGTAGIFNVAGEASGTTIVNNGNWYLIQGTWDGTNIKLNVNGTFESSKSMTGNLTPAELRMGGGFSNEYFSGNIAVLRIYNFALNTTQLTQNFNAQKSRYGY
jgi:hypothetical protein